MMILKSLKLKRKREKHTTIQPNWIEKREELEMLKQNEEDFIRLILNKPVLWLNV